MFAARLQSFGERLALVLEDGRTLTYAQLAQRADDVYVGAAIPLGALVAIECENTLASVAAYLGALRNGYPALLVDAQLDEQLRRRLYDHFDVSHVHDSGGNWISLGRPAPEVHPDVAVLLSTSGSTGSPKLVKLTAANLDANAASIVHYLELGPEERPITSLPIHYSYGLSVLNSHLSVGATVLLTGQPVTARKFWDLFREHGATSLAGVPTIYSMLKQLRFERMELPSLRTMTQAGGRLGPDMTRWFGELAQSRNQRFFVMYGQTEATARISYVPPHKLPEKIGSIGVAIPGGKLEIIGEDGNVTSAFGETGELRYTGPNVMMGYANDVEDLAEPDALNGVLLTGDLAMRDEDGFFHIVGRIKRFIKVFGNRIGLDEVEMQLRDDGYDVAVTGRDDLLVIAVRGGNEDTKDKLTAHASARYRLHRSAIRVHAVEDFPLSTAGKVQYAELLAALCP
ncbi:AMP-binding protein [Cupriavidus numazuensis]|uniref:2-succinylbenzoate--CoA ligase n=1 Tax=Cupriavidus numazuensis TaxID=221992 RepID=A0ABN7QAB6_9BURK|nr:AMP-binding protein [Cupriavidus numazuensis]CAG2158752.1 2-succinylbenzoate--CoA ligase [Cupriavidus numazuensis]